MLYEYLKNLLAWVDFFIVDFRS